MAFIVRDSKDRRYYICPECGGRLKRRKGKTFLTCEICNVDWVLEIKNNHKI